MKEQFQLWLATVQAWIRTLRAWRPNPNRLIVNDRYSGTDGLVQDLLKMWCHGVPWFWGFLPHVIRFFTHINVFHSFNNLCVEWARTQEGGDYDADYVTGHFRAWACYALLIAWVIP